MRPFYGLSSVTPMSRTAANHPPMRAPSHLLHPRLNQIRNLHRRARKVSQRAGALVAIAAGGDDDGFFGVVGLQDDEHAGVAAL